MLSRPSVVLRWRPTLSQGLIHHSGRGSQYYLADYQALLRKRGILISMSARGVFYNNSMVETFFNTHKSN